MVFRFKKIWKCSTCWICGKNDFDEQGTSGDIRAILCNDRDLTSSIFLSQTGHVTISSPTKLKLSNALPSGETLSVGNFVRVGESTNLSAVFATVVGAVVEVVIVVDVVVLVLLVADIPFLAGVAVLSPASLIRPILLVVIACLFFVAKEYLHDYSNEEICVDVGMCVQKQVRVQATKIDYRL